MEKVALPPVRAGATQVKLSVRGDAEKFVKTSSVE